MRVLFIMPLAYSVFPFQIAALSAYLKKIDHDVRYLELVLGNECALGEAPQKAIESELDCFKPDLVAFSSYDMTLEWIKQIAAVVKNKGDTPILVGGYMATLAPQAFYDVAEVDYIGIGEGEYIMEELLKKLKAGEECVDIPGVYARKNGRWVENPVKYLIEDLDALPFADRTIFDHQEHIGIPDEHHDAYLAIMASKGCPYKCSYCANEFLKRQYDNWKKYVRFRDPEKVCDEIEECARSYKFNKVSFEDDMFTANRGWLERFGEVYTKRIGLPFRCNIRPETASKKNVDLLAKIGCEVVSIGVESGDPEMRRTLLDRGMSDKLLYEAGRNLKSAGVKLRTFNMVGLPNETYLTLFRTIRMNFKLAPHEVQTCIYYPIKGTALGDKCYADGIVDLEKQKKIKEYAYETPLKNGKVPNSVIVMAKWINSAMGLRSGNVNLIKAAFLLLRNKFGVQRQWVSNLPQRKERALPSSST